MRFAAQNACSKDSDTSEQKFVRVPTFKRFEIHL